MKLERKRASVKQRPDVAVGDRADADAEVGEPPFPSCALERAAERVGEKPGISICALAIASSVSGGRRSFRELRQVIHDLEPRGLRVDEDVAFREMPGWSSSAPMRHDGDVPDRQWSKRRQLRAALATEDALVEARPGTLYASISSSPCTMRTPSYAVKRFDARAAPRDGGSAHAVQF